jgi:hypothetical protein
MELKRDQEMASGQSNVASYVLVALLASFTIVITVFVSLSLVTLNELDQCNSSVCSPSECWNAYCSGKDCIKERIDGCCDDEQCDNINGTNYNFGLLRVGNISSTANSTFGTVANSIVFKNGSVASVCLISDGSCTNTLGDTRVDTIYARNLVSQNDCMDISNGFMNVCRDGNVTMQGQVEFSQINVTNYLCLRRALPLSGGVIDINGVKILANSVNASNIVVTGNITVSNLTQLTQTDSLTVSGVKIVNNTAQGFVGGTNGVLLLNPDGGNVGLGIPTNDIDDVLYLAQTTSNIRAEEIQFYDSIETNGGVASNGLSTYQKSLRAANIDGPWNTSFIAQFIVERLGNVVTITLGMDLITNCSGNSTFISSRQVITSIVDLNYNGTTYDTRTRVINDSVEVEGIFMIKNGYVFISTTGLDSNGQGIVGGERTNFCGALKTTISYIAT